MQYNQILIKLYSCNLTNTNVNICSNKEHIKHRMKSNFLRISTINKMLQNKKQTSAEFFDKKNKIN